SRGRPVAPVRESNAERAPGGPGLTVAAPLQGVADPVLPRRFAKTHDHQRHVTDLRHQNPDETDMIMTQISDMPGLLALAALPPIRQRTFAGTADWLVAWWQGHRLLPGNRRQCGGASCVAAPGPGRGPLGDDLPGP